MLAIRACVIAMALLLSACAPLTTSEVRRHTSALSPADDALRSLLAESDEASLRRNPMDAIYRGLDRRVTRFGDFFSNAHVAATRDATHSELRRLDGIDRSELSPLGQVAYDTFRWNKTLELRRFQPPLTDVWMRLPLNSYFESWHLEFPSISAGDSVVPFRTVADYEDGLSRIDDYLAFLDRAIERMREGIAAGVVQPRLIVKHMIGQFDEFIEQGVQRSTFYGPILKWPASLPLSERDRLGQSYTVAIRERVLPTLSRVRDFLKTEYLPKAIDRVGLSQIPGGAHYYQHLIEEHTSTSMTPHELHRLGLGEVDRITRGMEEVKDRLGFAGSLHEFFQHIRTDPRFKPASAQALAEAYRFIGKRIDEAMPRLFRTFPRTALELRPVPPEVEKASAAAFYNSGTPDGVKPGVFYFNAYRLSDRTVETMEALYLHEAVPGHHFQSSLRREDAALPDLLRFGWNTAYIEGWALYAESLGPALGLYTDPYQRFGAYSQEMLRAVRLVVDTGLHALGWSRERAIDYMSAHLPSSREVLTEAVDRYIANPGQALAYKVGELTIARLRTKAERALGSSIDIREFHDQVLNTGAIPMTVLEAKIDAWIKDSKRR